MEKTLQRQLLEMLQTLEEGIRYIGQEGNPAMLRECITAIRAIRETCQQSLPVRRQAIYVDLFDGMAQALQQLPDQADQATLQQTTDLCQELIEYARQALQKELTRKKIMVFLPYKASMWDSLESVWKAAYEDKEHCETYVIPIPYCDRNPDMTAKEWHCEAGLFPDYVPVLDWREYSRDKLREMHPDVIFIHNPYDNFNAVTSVDMQYYSRNLKGIAEKLVYIPYFVVGDTIAPHFCQTQGVINADYVIVQDENIKEQYERYYPGGNPPKGKILALGSPKFDKVCNTTKDDYILPEEWQRLIGNKKVILYNTSLTAMLEHTDKFNAKLRYVFDAFKQRDDVVLWWRPHPLLRATIDSMTPEIREEYRQIEQAYINEGWGIYDDTPDMDRAIVCTDAYYGDMSSLVWLYRSTGKSMLIERLGIKDNASLKAFQGGNPIDEFVFHDGAVYFLDSHHVSAIALYKYDILNKKYKFLGLLPEKSNSQCESHRVLAVENEKIVMFPWGGEQIIQYDINKKTFNCVTKVDAYNCVGIRNNKSKKNRFCLCFRYRGFIYGVSQQGLIVKYNEKTIELCCYIEWYERLLNELSDNEKKDVNESFIWKGYLLKKGHLYLPIRTANVIVIIDLTTGNSKVLYVGSESNRYVGIDWDGHHYWLLDSNNYQVIKVNRDFIVIEKYLLPRAFAKQDIIFTNIVYHGKEQLYIYYATYVRNPLVMNTKDGRFHFGDGIDKNDFLDPEQWGYLYARRLNDGGEIVSYNAAKNNIVIEEIENGNNTVINFPLCYTKEKLEYFAALKNRCISQNIFYEENFMDGLIDFLHKILLKYRENGKYTKHDGDNVGHRIYFMYGGK